MIKIETYRKRTGPTYRAYFYQNRKKYQTGYYATQREAFEAGSALLSGMGNLGISNKWFSEAPFSVFLDHWVDHDAKGRKESWRLDQTRIELYIKPSLGAQKIATITPLVLKDFFKILQREPVSRGIDIVAIRELKKLGLSHQKIANKLGIASETVTKYLKEDVNTLSPATCNRIRSLLKKVFNDAIRIYQLVRFNPVDAIPKLKEPEDIIKFWTIEEVDRFFSTSVSSPYFDLYLFAINTGLRIGEVLGMNFSTINTQARKARIEQQWKSKEKRFAELKGKRSRIVPLNGTARSVISKRMAMRRFTDLVFHDGTGKPHMYHLIQTDFVRCCKTAGVEHIGLHGLRHNFATHYLMNGGDWHKLQKIMGHANFKTTLGYVHLVEDYLTEDPDVVEFKAPQGVQRVQKLRVLGSQGS